MSERTTVKAFFWLSGAAVLALDHLTKWAVYQRLLPSGRVRVIPGVFYLRPAQNTGAVWGLLDGRPAVVVVIGIVAVAAVILVFHRCATTSRLEAAGWGAILGGAVGNLVDRAVFGHVRDFLDFAVSGWHWPTFNVADVFICTGALGLAVVYTFSGKKTQPE